MIYKFLRCVKLFWSSLETPPPPPKVFCFTPFETEEYRQQEGFNFEAVDFFLKCNFIMIINV